MKSQKKRKAIGVSLPEDMHSEILSLVENREEFRFSTFFRTLAREWISAQRCATPARTAVRKSIFHSALKSGEKSPITDALKAIRF